jgi:hypothetical protein
MPDRGVRRVGYHGTSFSAALSLLNGAELRLEVALEQKIDGPSDFYLADDPDAVSQGSRHWRRPRGAAAR